MADDLARAEHDEKEREQKGDDDPATLRAQRTDEARDPCERRWRERRRFILSKVRPQEDALQAVPADSPRRDAGVHGPTRHELAEVEDHGQPRERRRRIADERPYEHLRA